MNLSASNSPEMTSKTKPGESSEVTGFLTDPDASGNSLKGWFCRRFALYYDWKLVDYDRWVSNKFKTLMNEIDLLNLSEKEAEKADIDVLRPFYYQKLNEIKAEFLDKKTGEFKKQPKVRDLLLLEKCVIRFLPPVELSLKSILVEGNYRNIVGQKVFDEVKQTFSTTKIESPESVVDRRTELCFMLDHIQDIYTNAPVRDGAQSSLLRFSLFTVVSVYVGLFLILILINQILPLMKISPWPYSALVVPLMGSIGAFISVTQRAQSLSSDGDSVQNAMKLNCGLFAITFGIIISGVFAVIINLFFLAGYIKGGVFPFENDSVPNGLTGAFIFLLNLHSLQGTVIAKILIWSIVAGFSERLIPDNLSKLQETLTSADKKGHLDISEMKTTSIAETKQSGINLSNISPLPAELSKNQPAKN